MPPIRFGQRSGSLTPLAADAGIPRHVKPNPLRDARDPRDQPEVTAPRIVPRFRST